MEKGLVLNTSYDIFTLGDNISNYEHLDYHKKHYDDPCGFDSYEFERNGYIITIWSEDGHVNNICCRDSGNRGDGVFDSFS